MASRVNITRSAGTVLRGNAAVARRGARGNATQSTVRMNDAYMTTGRSRFGELERTATGRVKTGSGKS